MGKRNLSQDMTKGVSRSNSLTEEDISQKQIYRNAIPLRQQSIEEEKEEEESPIKFKSAYTRPKNRVNKQQKAAKSLRQESIEEQREEEEKEGEKEEEMAEGSKKFTSALNRPRFKSSTKAKQEKRSPNLQVNTASSSGKNEPSLGEKSPSPTNLQQRFRSSVAVPRLSSPTPSHAKAAQSTKPLKAPERTTETKPNAKKSAARSPTKRYQRQKTEVIESSSEDEEETAQTKKAEGKEEQQIPEVEKEIDYEEGQDYNSDDIKNTEKHATNSVIKKTRDNSDDFVDADDA